MAILTPSLVKLRDGFNLIAPARDKASDGWIGNAAHAANTSGHNPDESGRAERQDADRIDEVRALDVDKDLRTPGLTMQQCVQKTLNTAQDRRRLIYIIWNRTIWSASNGWQPRAYTGSNAHTLHAHFSGHPDYDNDDRPWGIEELADMPLTDADIDRLAERLLRYDPNQVGKGVASPYGDPKNPTIAVGTALTNTLGVVEQLDDKVDALAAQVAALAARPDPDTVTITDEQLERVLRRVVGSVDGASPPAAKQG